MADNHTKHEHGTMNIEAQERAFAGFIKYSKNVAIFCIVLLILLAIFNG